MLPGEQVFWWGAKSAALSDMLTGFAVSKEPLVGTFNGQSLEVQLVNATWSDMGILAVWSTEMASDYGHIVLSTNFTETKEPGRPPPPPFPPPALHPPPHSLSLSPANAEVIPEEDGPTSAPSPDSDSLPYLPPAPEPDAALPLAPPPPEKLGPARPTMFQNCLQLSHRFRVRWTVSPDKASVDVGLEAAVDLSSYLAFGWADPEALDDLMPYADLIVAGYNDMVRGQPGSRWHGWGLGRFASHGVVTLVGVGHRESPLRRTTMHQGRGSAIGRPRRPRGCAPTPF